MGSHGTGCGGRRRCAATAAALGLCGLLACAAPGGREEGQEAPGLLGRSRVATLPDLGRVTGLSAGPRGVIWVVGRRGVARVAPEGRARRVLAFAERPGPNRPEAPGDGEAPSLFVDRGGGEPRVAVYGSDGRARWSRRALALAAGDLEGDGRLDLVVGLEGPGGLQRLAPDGRTVWSRPALDPAWIELADLDGDGRLEILHHRLGDVLMVRDGEGRVLNRISLEPPHAHPVRHFAVVRWPGEAAPPRIAIRAEGSLRLLDLEGGAVVAALPTPIWNAEGTFRVATFASAGGRGRSGRWLALLDVPGGDSPAVLTVWDGTGRRVHDEVLDPGCGALAAAPGEGSLLVGCARALWRYGPDEPAGRRGPSVAAWRGRGDLFGPLSGGMPAEAAWAARRLLPGHRCRGSACGLSYLRLGGHDFVLAPHFVHGLLEGVLLVGLPEPVDGYDGATRAAWGALVDHFAAELGAPDIPPRVFPNPSQVRSAPDRGPWRAWETHRWSGGGREVELGVLTLASDGAVQFAPYARVFAVSSAELGPGHPAAGE